MDTAIGLCSRALVKCGSGPISSFDEGSAEAEVANALYAGRRDGCLAQHPWSFAKAQATLARLAASPLADYEHAYQLPTDYLRIISAGETAGRGLDYRILEGRLHTDADQVVLTYIFRQAESQFPAWFDQMLVAYLAAEFCLPLTENASRAELLWRQAEMEFARAKTLDSQAQPAQAIEHFPLVEVRG